MSFSLPLKQEGTFSILNAPLAINRSAKLRISLAIFILCFFCVASAAQPYTGPIIQQYGPAYPNASKQELPKDIEYKVMFDIDQTPDSHYHLNRDIESAARFLNMMGQNSVPMENVQVVVLLRGRATKDALKAETYERIFRHSNPNYHLMSILKKNGVKIYVDGQSLGFWGLEPSDVSDVVELTYSAITLKVILSQQGFIFNP